MILQGVFTVGTIVAFGAYLTQLYGPLSSISNAHVEFATSMVSFERVFEVLDEEALVVTGAHANQGPAFKRVRPAPMGRAYRVLKRTAHITVRVAERE